MTPALVASTHLGVTLRQLRYAARLAAACAAAAFDVLTRHLARGSDAPRHSDHRRTP